MRGCVHVCVYIHAVSQRDFMKTLTLALVSVEEEEEEEDVEEDEEVKDMTGLAALVLEAAPMRKITARLCG